MNIPCSWLLETGGWRVHFWGGKLKGSLHSSLFKTCLNLNTHKKVNFKPSPFWVVFVRCQGRWCSHTTNSGRGGIIGPPTTLQNSSSYGRWPFISQELWSTGHLRGFFFPDPPPTTQAFKVVCAHGQNWIAQNEACRSLEAAVFFLGVFEETALRGESHPSL